MSGYVIDGNGCHVWVGATSGGGYGIAMVDGRVQAVHRVRYAREVGPIPDDMELDHYMCDNGAGGCCNPLHCRPVTPWETSLRSDGASSVNAAKTHCPKGHPLLGDNLCVGELRRGVRRCLACRLEGQRRRALNRKLG